MPKIILIAGRAESGKGTVSDIFKNILESQNKKVLTISFGDMVKFYCTKYFGWDGVKDEKGRSLLQYVGDMFRNKQRDYWGLRVCDAIHFFGDQYDAVLIPDWRYPNELNCILQFFAGDGIFTFWVNRDGYENTLTDEQRKHSSECSISASDCDYIIQNNNMDDLIDDSKRYIKFIFGDD